VSSFLDERRKGVVRQAPAESTTVHEVVNGGASGRVIYVYSLEWQTKCQFICEVRFDRLTATQSCVRNVRFSRFPATETSASSLGI
ncbi:MAG: hypothetical protein N0E58_05180, partial [Candidatus Thiodiazotropha endolucinida]|nr:hypothetical protein [Candidatus Thiodiazotropha taylori]MCW4235640.1 hypothetical protein [Candidatus Thiodiazotropha endolucinida]